MVGRSVLFFSQSKMIEITGPIPKAENGYNFLSMRITLEVNMRRYRVSLLCRGIGGRRKRGNHALPRYRRSHLIKMQYVSPSVRALQNRYLDVV